MTVEERMKMIDAKLDREKQKEVEEREYTQRETERLKKEIMELKPRIDDLIKLGNYALQKGIDISHSGYGGNEGYDTGMFISNSWSHVVGFIKVGKEIKYVGRIAGGAYGDWDFQTDGSLIFERTYQNNQEKRRDPELKILRVFVDRFPKFEKAFYDYIDNYCTKEN